MHRRPLFLSDHRYKTEIFLLGVGWPSDTQENIKTYVSVCRAFYFWGKNVEIAAEFLI